MAKENKYFGKKEIVIGILVIILIIVFFLLYVNFNNSSEKRLVGVQSIEKLKNETGCSNNADLEKTAECISKKATIYTQLGCHACQVQEKKFGEEFEHLDVVDCYKQENRQKCINKKIKSTPTWIIKNGN